MGHAAVVSTTLVADGDPNCDAGGTLVNYGIDLNDNNSFDLGEGTGHFYVCTGLAGSAAEVTTTRIPSDGSSQDCPTGGVQIEIGVKGAPPDTQFVCNGTQGSQGSTGATGHDSLVVSTPIDVGDTMHCAGNGGVQIDVGVDDDGDGNLDGPIPGPTEIDSTRYVCNGSSTGHDVLVRSTRVDSIDGCSAGAVKIESGIDLDDSHTLDNNEVIDAQTQYACDGAVGPAGPQGPTGVQGDQGERGPQGDQGAQGAQGSNGQNGPSGIDGRDGNNGDNGHDAASRVIPLAEGSSQCPAGGALVEAGVDDNGNGSLDDEEVDDSQTVCNGTDGAQQVFSFEQIAVNAECGTNKGVMILSGLDDGSGGGIANNGILEASEVDVRRALCVTGSDLSVKDDGGCSIANGAGSGTGSDKQAFLWLAGMTALVVRRRRRTQR